MLAAMPRKPQHQSRTLRTQEGRSSGVLFRMQLDSCGGCDKQLLLV